VIPDDVTPSRIDLPAAPADQAAILDAGGVACWSEPLWIDTYEPGEPDPYPLFLDRRVYQGSSGRVYPLPMVDSVSHEKAPRQWQAIHLENAYVRLVLLPEIGGRIHIGYDKVAGYDFFYRNNVIKPALVGLAGPWISGGVEFNWPQHHRPATFLPVDARIDREDDGAVVVWHSDLDPLQRMRGLHGVRLRPDSSVIELEAALHNRTDVPQTFLWWANVAARVHEQYQSFFPDDVAYVADHARRAITAFPRADRDYYGVDYPALGAADGHAEADRIDIYSNIPVPTSYMITDTDDDFFGGYDHAADAGFVHWADRAISPGKKQWTWGDGPIGRAWDDQLTDGDGPYVELMAGVYTDNQPDFSWLLPGETKRFSQFWYPIHKTGPARQATTEAAVGVQADGARTRVTALTTRVRRDALVVVRRDGEELGRWGVDLGPDRPFAATIEVGADAPGLEVEVQDAGRPLVTWRSRAGEPLAPEPWLATAPPLPEEIASADELYATASHLLQYRHPSRSAVPYLREVLRRDPSDVRAATTLGAWHLHRGEYADAADLLDVAMERQTARNLNPRDGETVYLRGLVAERLGDAVGADRWFAKAAWNFAFAAPAALARARLALRAGRTDAALRLARDAGDIPEARRLASLALARLGDPAGATTVLSELADADPLDPGTRALRGEAVALDARMPLDVAAEFARAGAYDEALAATATVSHATPAAGLAGPVRGYLRALWLERAGRPEDAAAERRVAQQEPTALAFPSGLDQYDALTAAVAADASDAVAAGLLGMWLLDAGRADDALARLRAATDAGSTDPVVWRNLAIALVAAEGDEEAADAALVRALALRADARLVFERDVLAVRRGLDSAARLALLERHPGLLGQRDDLAVRHANLLLDADRVDEAWRLLTTRRFRPFEGGEGQAIAAFDRASCLRAETLLGDAPADAAALLEAGFTPPPTLGEGRHPAERPVQRWVLLGVARQAAGDGEGAAAAWRAAVEPTPLAVAPRPADVSTYWRGIAFLHLGDRDAAEQQWAALDSRADELRVARDEVDYFATSVPELTLFDVGTAEVRALAAGELQRLAADGRARQAAGVGDVALIGEDGHRG
jgi:tetratricopeptide (TPR) repeat protein